MRDVPVCIGKSNEYLQFHNINLIHIFIHPTHTYPRLPPITPDYTRNQGAITLWNARCCAPARLPRSSMSPAKRPWRRRGPDAGAKEHGFGTQPASGALDLAM